jgi:AhpD family alkylhydroperoxidase
MGIISGCGSGMWKPRPTRRCYARGRGRPEPLYALVKIRAAQLNGCAYCLDTRNRDARAGGKEIMGYAGMVHVLRPSPLSTCGTAWRCAAIRTCQT